MESWHQTRSWWALQGPCTAWLGSSLPKLGIWLPRRHLSSSGASMKTQVVFLLRAPPLHHQAERGMQRGSYGTFPVNAASLRNVCSTRTVVPTCHVVHSGRWTGRKLQGNRLVKHVVSVFSLWIRGALIPDRCQVSSTSGITDITPESCSETHTEHLCGKKQLFRFRSCFSVK